MVTYLINTTLCALLLYAVYGLLLEKENMHRFKRMYLLFSLVFSLTVPLVTVNLFVPQLRESIEVFYTDIIETKIADNPLQEQPAVETGRAPSLSAQETKSPVDYSLIIFSIYGLITTALLFRLLKNAFQILACGRNNPSVDYFDARIVLIEEKLVPHSFGKYIFLNRTDYETGRIAEEIIIHEWAHVRQKHSLDNIFVEMLIVFFWFNPVCYWYKKKIKLNHEFLADESVIRSKRTISDYQMLLICSANQQQNRQLASNFNYLITKKRLIMMTKTTSKTRAFCKEMALIPVLCAATIVFSTKTMAKDAPDVFPKQTVVQEEETLLTVGQGVSQELLDEYKAIESKYIETKKTSKGGVKITRKTNLISEDDWKRMYIIYIQMKEEQQWEQYVRFIGSSNPTKFGDSKSPKHAPNDNLWKIIKDAEIIWLDGARVEPTALDSFVRTDVYFCLNNRYLNHFILGNSEKSCTVLWTEKGYEAYLQQYAKQIPVSKLLEMKPQVYHISERHPDGRETIVGSSAR